MCNVSGHFFFLELFQKMSIFTHKAIFYDLYTMFIKLKLKRFFVSNDWHFEDYQYEMYVFFFCVLQVRNIYRDPSLKNYINVVVVKFIIFQSKEVSYCVRLLLFRCMPEKDSAYKSFKKRKEKKEVFMNWSCTFFVCLFVCLFVYCGGDDVFVLLSSFSM